MLSYYSWTVSAAHPPVRNGECLPELGEEENYALNGVHALHHEKALSQTLGTSFKISV